MKRHAGGRPKGSQTVGYVPFDELLDQPMVRLLRTLRHFGWVTCDDLYEAAGIAEEKRSRSGAYQALSRAVRRNEVARKTYREMTPNGFITKHYYRITPAGLVRLGTYYARTEVGLHE